MPHSCIVCDVMPVDANGFLGRAVRERIAVPVQDGLAFDTAVLSGLRAIARHTPETPYDKWLGVYEKAFSGTPAEVSAFRRYLPETVGWAVEFGLPSDPKVALRTVEEYKDMCRDLMVVV